MVTFVQAIFVLTTFSISWIAQLFLTQFWPNFLGALIFSDQNSFWPKIFLDPKFFGLKKVLTKLFWTQNFFDSKLFQDKFKDDSTSTKLSSTQLGISQPQLVLFFFDISKTKFVLLNISASTGWSILVVPKVFLNNFY